MNVRIKGTKDGLLITLDEEGEWEQVRQSLLDYLDKQANFLKSGETKEATRLLLDVGARTLKAAELGALRDQISERGLTLWAVLSSSATTEGDGTSARPSNAYPYCSYRPPFSKPGYGCHGQRNSPVFATNTAIWHAHRARRACCHFRRCPPRRRNHCQR
jgi:hypothetical protein